MASKRPEPDKPAYELPVNGREECKQSNYLTSVDSYHFDRTSICSLEFVKINEMHGEANELALTLNSTI